MVKKSDNVQCSICLELLFIKTSKNKWKARKKANCENHWFHKECIEEWEARSARCPLCNQTGEIELSVIEPQLGEVDNDATRPRETPEERERRKSVGCLLFSLLLMFYILGWVLIIWNWETNYKRVALWVIMGCSTIVLTCVGVVAFK